VTRRSSRDERTSARTARIKFRIANLHAALTVVVTEERRTRELDAFAV
jgi:hypothetical protein